MYQRLAHEHYRFLAALHGSIYVTVPCIRHTEHSHTTITLPDALLFL